MFNGGLPESLGHPVTRQLESNRTLKVFKLQTHQQPVNNATQRRP